MPRRKVRKRKNENSTKNDPFVTPRPYPEHLKKLNEERRKEALKRRRVLTSEICALRQQKQVAEKRLEEHKKLLELAKSPGQMRTAIAGLCDELNYNPIRELIEKAMDPDTSAKEKKDIAKTLLPYIAPTLKSIDIQADIDHNVSVSIQSYVEANQKDLKEAMDAEITERREGEALSDEDYTEFQDDSDGEEEIIAKQAIVPPVEDGRRKG